MKKYIIILILVFSCNKTETIDNSYAKYSRTIDNQKFERMQEKIHSAFDYSFKFKDYSKLDSISNEIIESDKINPYDLKKYWAAYAKYHTFLLSTLIELDNEKSKEIIDSAILYLEKINNMNYEEIVLLTRLKAHSIAYNNSLAPILSAQVNSNLNKLSKIDDANPRLIFIKSNFLYYNPNIKDKSNIENWCKISLTNSTTINNKTYLPSWGEEETFSLLIKYLSDIGREDESKEIYQKALNKFSKNRIRSDY